MIPKILHYCWFGTKPIPQDYQGYIEGWKKLMPDYKVKLWNEKNSPMHLPYMQAAIKYKKWANVANFARIYALYHEGGIYMDTDMEVLKSLEVFRQYGCFLGWELGEKDGENLVINNAIFGAEKQHPFIVKCMEFYLKNFDGRETALDSSPYLVTRLLKELGLNQYGRQNIGGVELFPKAYFYPYHITEKFHPDCVNENTYTIHHWGYSWGKRPFSYRLEHLKQVTKEKIYQTLPIHIAAKWKHGKMVGDLLKGNKVKAGSFQGIELPISKDYEQQNLPLKLAGLYKEELQSVLYKLSNEKYDSIFYYGENGDYFGKGIAQLFPNSEVEIVNNILDVNGLKPKTLVVTNSNLAKKIASEVSQLPNGIDFILEFNYHLSKEEKEKIVQKTIEKYAIEWVNSELDYNYEKNAFLVQYSIAEIENHLKREVLEVREWLVLKWKGDRNDEF